MSFVKIIRNKFSRLLVKKCNFLLFFRENHAEIVTSIKNIKIWKRQQFSISQNKYEGFPVGSVEKEKKKTKNREKGKGKDLLLYFIFFLKNKKKEKHVTRKSDHF